MIFFLHYALMAFSVNHPHDILTEMNKNDNCVTANEHVLILNTSVDHPFFLKPRYDRCLQCYHFKKIGNTYVLCYPCCINHFKYQLPDQYRVHFLELSNMHFAYYQIHSTWREGTPNNTQILELMVTTYVKYVDRKFFDDNQPQFITIQEGPSNYGIFKSFFEIINEHYYYEDLEKCTFANIKLTNDQMDKCNKIIDLFKLYMKTTKEVNAAMNMMDKVYAEPANNGQYLLRDNIKEVIVYLHARIDQYFMDIQCLSRDSPLSFIFEKIKSLDGKLSECLQNFRKLVDDKEIKNDILLELKQKAKDVLDELSSLHIEIITYCDKLNKFQRDLYYHANMLLRYKWMLELNNKSKDIFYYFAQITSDHTSRSRYYDVNFLITTDDAVLFLIKQIDDYSPLIAGDGSSCSGDEEIK